MKTMPGLRKARNSSRVEGVATSRRAIARSGLTTAGDVRAMSAGHVRHGSAKSLAKLGERSARWFHAFVVWMSVRTTWRCASILVFHTTTTSGCRPATSSCGDPILFGITARSGCRPATSSCCNPTLFGIATRAGCRPATSSCDDPILFGIAARTSCPPTTSSCDDPILFGIATRAHCRPATPSCGDPISFGIATISCCPSANAGCPETDQARGRLFFGSLTVITFDASSVAFGRWFTRRCRMPRSAEGASFAADVLPG